jgi:hypothetical protein
MSDFSKERDSQNLEELLRELEAVRTREAILVREVRALVGKLSK